jgi:hypothetical protein
MTARPEGSLHLEYLQPSLLDITKEKIVPELKTIIKYRLKTLPQLSKLRPTVKKLIVRMMVEKADCKSKHSSSVSLLASISFLSKSRHCLLDRDEMAHEGVKTEHTALYAPGSRDKLQHNRHRCFCSLLVVVCITDQRVGVVSV